MRIKKAVLISLMCASLTLAGCWDQNLLKDISLVLTASLDVDHDGKNKIGITYRKVRRPRRNRKRAAHSLRRCSALPGTPSVKRGFNWISLSISALTRPSKESY